MKYRSHENVQIQFKHSVKRNERGKVQFWMDEGEKGKYAGSVQMGRGCNNEKYSWYEGETLAESISNNKKQS